MSELALQLIAENKRTKNPKLDLGRTGLTELPKELFDCIWLEELVLSNYYWDVEKGEWGKSINRGLFNNFKFINEKISSLQWLKVLKLTQLRVVSKQAHSFNFLGTLINLVSLELGYNQISNIRFLEKLINLQFLDLSSNEIIETRFLENLKKLQSLNLSSNKISDTSFLGRLTGLQSLDLSFNEIKNAPFLEKLTDLQSLDLSSNQIKDAHFIQKLTRLQSFKLSSNKISDTSFLEKLTSLHSLDLSSNLIKNANYLEQLTSLQSLNLNSNQIRETRFLEKLTGLQTLNLNSNHIKDTRFLEKLTGLRTLKLSSNPNLNTHFLGKVTGLQSLNLGSNEIVDVRFLERLTSLQLLDLRFNNISDARFLENLINLESLDLRYNQISNARFLEKLTSLQSLNLGFNQIVDAHFLEKLTSLQSLDLSSNKISDYCFLEKLISLQSLELNSNKILDASFLEKLTSLQSLNLSSNQIKDADFLKKLILIEKLDISENQIEDISPLLPLLQRQDRSYKIVFKNKREVNNSEINLKDNPLKEPPFEIIEQGNEAIINYFKELKKQGVEYLYEAKMLIVGQPRAGKTSLRNKLFDIKSKLPDEDKTTRGIDIQPLEFDIIDKEKKIRKFKYNVWDFGGQHIYQTTHQFFLTHRSLYLLVMDTGKDSTGNDDSTINYWLQAVELLGGNSPMLLVRNEKNDRLINIDLSQKRARFNFLKNDHNVDLNALVAGTQTFKESRLNDFNKLKEDIETELKRLPLVGFPMPKNWVRIREELQKLSELHPYISLHSYTELCSQFDVTEFEKQMELSRIFHDLGIFLHFQDYGTLEDFIILQNVWATDAVFAVLDNAEVQDGKGKFTDSELTTIWKAKDYESKVHKKLLALMMQFELCYQVDKVKDIIYIIPEMLPNSAHESYEWKPDNDLPLQYRYDFMPRGMLTRLIVRLHRHIEIQNNQQFVWKSGVKINGISLDCPNTFAEIKEEWNNRQLLLRVQGIFCKDLMSKITYEIDLLNREFFRSTDGIESAQKSKWHKMIPCNCETCRNSTDNHFYDYATLLKAREKNKDIQCQKSFDDIRVSELLDGVFSKDGVPKSTIIKKNIMNPPKIFISYSHLDEKPWKDELVKHLASLKNQDLISAWTDRQIEAGMWNEQIEKAMEKTDIFLLLITANFLASSYITSKEITKAYEMYKVGRAKIFPIICDSCKWQLQPITKTEKEWHPTMNREMNMWLGKFQPFPKDGIPIQNWPNKNDGFLDVINQLERHL